MNKKKRTWENKKGLHIVLDKKRAKILDFLIDNGFAKIKNKKFIITDKGVKFFTTAKKYLKMG